MKLIHSNISKQADNGMSLWAIGFMRKMRKAALKEFKKEIDEIISADPIKAEKYKQ